MLGPIAERLAERLGAEKPVIHIATDDAVNAFSAYSGQRTVLFYTEGFLAEFSLVSQRPQIEVVTAHLLARAAAGDNALTVAANGLLNWALFLFSAVVAGFAYILGKLGIAFLTSDAHKRLKPGPSPYGDDMVNRLIVWGISVFIGLWLLMAAVVVVLLGGILVVVAGSVRLGLTRQRVRIADAVAAQVIDDPQALHAAFGRFLEIGQRGERRIDLTSRKQVLHDLCFDDSSHRFPRLPSRAASLSSPASSAEPGALTPVLSGLALACLIAGVVVLVARIPYGQPFGAASVNGQQPVALSSPSPDGGGLATGTDGGQQTQPASPQSSTGQASPNGQSPANQSPGSQTSAQTPTGNQTSPVQIVPPVTGPPSPPSTACQPDGTGCTPGGDYPNPNAVINSDYSGLSVTWTSTSVQPYSSGVPLYWTVGVTFTNVSSSGVYLDCSADWATPSNVGETMSGGAGDDGWVSAETTTCNDNPSWSATLAPGDSVTVHATFHNVPWPGSAVSIAWGSAGTSPSIYPFS